ncbi:MAG TPA: YkgJ family cysteine cluster protein [Pseudomonadales bacterium]|nr:YkgJ family cysteine cluster protein [Pseudomonadales bacterium]
MKDCNQCGKCCIRYGGDGLSATAEEVAYWQAFRPAIADHVRDGQIWRDPATGAALDACPWLEVLTEDPVSGPITYGCRIYDDRPEECRHYPTAIAEMVRDGCEMIELRDLDAPRKAQVALDRLMADSRPPLA